MKKILNIIFFVTVWGMDAEAQVKEDDTLHWKRLPDVTIVGRNSKSDYQQMPEIVGTNIYAGKKNALIVLDNVQGNVVNNTMRQVLAKVPGIHVWESDPSGIQIGIATRGLSPNRSWEFNVRQNGYDIAADPFGYPEAYFNPPLQSVQRIEIVRGQSSLQYGPQFGGMVNYILRNGSEINKPFELETYQTVGSNNLRNSFTAIGGKNEKINYYTFFDQRAGDGWRSNSQFFTKSGFGTISYHVNKKLDLTFEVLQSHIRSQQPGGLTDQQILQNPQQSLRQRNWMDITWTTPAIIANYKINQQTIWNTKLYATIGDRNSVGYLQGINIKDSVNSNTLQYNPRLVNLDKYRNYGLESKLITDYSLGKMKNTISAGLRLYTGSTHRLADGKGSTSSNYDISIEGLFPRDISFVSNNAAVFVENIFRVSDKFYIIPGIRYEWLEGSASGRNGFNSNTTPIVLQNISRSRSFVLAGIGTEYHIAKNTEIYANISQAYRPIQFANLQAPPTTDIVDPNLKDAKGFNADLGYRGKIKSFLQFDLSVFYLNYNNRIGTITPNGKNYRLITNVGASNSRGFESYIEFNPVRAFSKSTTTDCIVFASYSYTNATYSGNHADASTKGKKVENAPANILRAGITMSVHALQLTAQMSKVDETYSDANNTRVPSANGNTGLIPAYTVTDLTATYKIAKNWNIKSGINNLLNATYFTRRAGGYPGPGALPADGRNFFVTVSAKL
ncbi:MAG: TonB-dependent receptor family protein [Chitinophagaceae bacterium]|jgi:Fe(3+) dicitrate transport protein